MTAVGVTINRPLTAETLPGIFFGCRDMDSFDMHLNMYDLQMNNYTNAIIGDPQFWRMRSNSGDDVKEENQRWNRRTIRTLNKMNPDELTVVGDMTEYFASDEFYDFVDHYEYHEKDEDGHVTNKIKKLYIGVGNHDIQNNYNDKWFSGLYLGNGAEGAGKAGSEYWINHLRCSTKEQPWKALGTTLRAYSLEASAFAWIENGIYNIHLNHFWEKEGVNPYFFTNAKKAEFLEQQLEKVKKYDIKAMVYVHIYNDPEFKKIYAKYQDYIIGVFSGHLHHKHGKYGINAEKELDREVTYLDGYVYNSEEEAESACKAKGYSGLCEKNDLIRKPLCAAGYAKNYNGYYMEDKRTGCGQKGFNGWSGKSGAYCCGETKTSLQRLDVFHTGAPEYGTFLTFSNALDTDGKYKGTITAYEVNEEDKLRVVNSWNVNTMGSSSLLCIPKDTDGAMLICGKKQMQWAGTFQEESCPADKGIPDCKPVQCHTITDDDKNSGNSFYKSCYNNMKLKVQNPFHHGMDNKHYHIQMEFYYSELCPLPCRGDHLNTEIDDSSRVADCPTGYTNTGLLCHRDVSTHSIPSRRADCPEGYHNTGLTCLKPADTIISPTTSPWCPGGYTNMGLYCYRWWWPKATSLRCPSGYEANWGSCRKHCPNGYHRTFVGTCYVHPHTLSEDSMTCRYNEQYSIGICYGLCQPGYNLILGHCSQPPHAVGTHVMSCKENEKYFLGRCFP